MAETLEVTIEAKEVSLEEAQGAINDFTLELDLEPDYSDSSQAPVGEMDAFGVGIVVAAIIKWTWPIILAKVLSLAAGDLEAAVEWLYKKLKELIRKLGKSGDVVLEDKASGKKVRLSAGIPDDALKELARPGFFDRFEGAVISYDRQASAWASAPS